MTTDDTECSICMLKFVHPVQLPCGHIFCFLCIKGCAFHRKRCPMCRSRFTQQFFENPKLINDQIDNGVEGIAEPQTIGCCETIDQTTEVHSWFYEGYSGWWQYDERTTSEIESAFRDNQSSCDLMIAGYIYTVDFHSMTQCRKDRSGRKRRIKRDTATSEMKGIAGIPLSCMSAPEQAAASQEDGTATASTSHSDAMSPSPRARSSASSPAAVHSTHRAGQRRLQTRPLTPVTAMLPGAAAVGSPVGCPVVTNSLTTMGVVVAGSLSSSTGHRRVTRSSARNQSI